MAILGQSLPDFSLLERHKAVWLENTYLSAQGLALAHKPSLNKVQLVLSTFTSIALTTITTKKKTTSAPCNSLPELF